nr:immunoglobulin heavy chain junction region [Mus musculus]
CARHPPSITTVVAEYFDVW